MSGATMALLECIKDSEHYLVHTLDSVLIKHAVVEALEKIAFLRARVEVLEGQISTIGDAAARAREAFLFRAAGENCYESGTVDALLLAIDAALAGGGKEGEDG